MKKTLTLLSLALMGVSAQSFAQALSQNFEGVTPPALPTGWAQMSSGSGWKTGTNATLASTYFAIPAHTNFIAVNDDKDSSDNNSADTLTTSAFSLTGINGAYVTFDQCFLKGQDANGNSESFKVLLSTNGGTTWSLLQDMAGNSQYYWETKGISLASANGDANVKLAFVYNDIHEWMYGVALDNILVSVPPTAEIGLSAVTPVAGMPQAYGTTGSNVALGGTVTNNGTAAVTSYNVNYLMNSGNVVSTPQSANIPFLGTGTFSVNVPMPATAGDYPVKVWVSLTGDTNPANDSGATTLSAVAAFPMKKLVFEECTGTWCGWCVRGIVFMDSVQELHGGSVSPIAVHNNDPMVVSAYDSYMGSFITGFPSVVVDRREVYDPQDILDVYNAESNYFGYASVAMNGPSISGTTVNVPVSVTPYTDLSGDYRLVLVVEEDSVHGTGSSWDQHNYYSTQSQNQPLTGQGVNYQTSPFDLPAAQMYYKFVARSITPSVTGTAGMLPSSMTTGTAYTANLTATLDPSWNTHNIRLVTMMLRASDGMVMNSDVTMWPLGLGNVNAGITGVSLYPSPATTVTNMTFSLDNASNVMVAVSDEAGRIVYMMPSTQMAQGEQHVTIPTSNFPAGIYNVQVKTENGGTIVRRFTVIK